MKSRNYLTIFITILNVHIFLLTNVNGQTTEIKTETEPKKIVHVPKCTDFLYKRHTESHSAGSTTIPPRKVTHMAYNSQGKSIILELQEDDSKKLKCGTDKAEQISVTWELDSPNPTLESQNFDVSSERHQHSYFTETGDFYDKRTGNYYKPDGEYCVHSISDKRIDLRVCAANGDCTSTSTPNTYCLPKCCALDEVLLFWRRECKRRNETQGRTPWKQIFYEGPNNPHKQVQRNMSIIYHMAPVPQNCYRIEHDSAQDQRWWSSGSFVKHPTIGEPPQEKDHIKMVLPTNGKNGKIQFMSFYHSNRKWQMETYQNYCMEGFYVKSKDQPEYTGNADNFVVFYCPNPSKNVPDQKWKSWMYIITSLLALLFLLATIFVYLMLWDQQNLHALTIFSYTGTTFGSYLFLTVAHFISLFPNPGMTGLHSRGAFCYTIAILAHFFYLSSYLWLTVMNFDLWVTFKYIRVARRDSKECSKYAAYSAFAFGLPVALIAAFVTVDEVYRNPLTEVPVPDYAIGTCFVSPDFRGEYVYTPMAIILGINIMLICMTMWIFLQARSQTSKSLNTGGSSNMNRYDAKLFSKLFVVMGGTSIVDFLTWYYNNKGHKPWPIVILEVISYFTPVALFILFCLNDKVIGQLREKFPELTDKLAPVLTLFTSQGAGSDQSSASSNRTNVSSVDTRDRKGESIPLSSVD